MNQQNTVAFVARWHRLCLGIFVVCWTTMLVPQLLFPDHAVARLLALTLVGIGSCAVLAILINGLWSWLSLRKGLRHRI
jgi:hypothetical protein